MYIFRAAYYIIFVIGLLVIKHLAGFENAVMIGMALIIVEISDLDINLKK